MCPTAVRHFDDVIKYCRRTPQRTFFLVSFEIVSLWRLKPCTCVCCKRFQIWSQTRLLLSPILAGPGKPHLPHFLLGTVQCCWRGCRLWHMIWLELGLLFPRTVIMICCGTLWWRHNSTDVGPFDQCQVREELSSRFLSWLCRCQDWIHALVFFVANDSIFELSAGSIRCYVVYSLKFHIYRRGQSTHSWRKWRSLWEKKFFCVEISEMGLFHISSPKLKCFGAEMDFGAKKINKQKCFDES